MKLSRSLLVFLFVGIAVTGFFVVALFYSDVLQAAVYVVQDGTSLSASVNSSSSISISWSGVVLCNGCTEDINRCTGAGCAPGTLIASVNAVANNNGYTDNGLSCGTTYRYKVCSVYGCTLIADATTVCLPAAPTSFTATPVSQTQNNLSWTASTGATGYYVYRSGGILVGSTAGTSYSDTGLSCNTERIYWVVAYNAGGNSAVSNSASASTDQCTPGTPTIGTASTIDQTSASVSWTRNSPLTDSGFQIFTSGGSWQGSASAGATSGTASSLTASTSYAFYVRAYVSTNGRTYYSGNSANSNTITTDVATPGTPTIGTATCTGQTTASLTYTANAPLTATTLNVNRNGVLTYSASPTSPVNIPSLTANTSYYFSIVAYVTTNGRTYYSGQSADSNVCTTLPDPPAAPTVLTATPASQTQINLAWTDNATNETGYYVYRGGAQIATLGANSASYSDTGLTCNTGHSYYVIAYNTGGNSVASNTASATTSACDITPPTVSFNPITQETNGTISVTPTASDPSGVTYTRHCWNAGATCDPLTTTASTFTNGTALTQITAGTWYLCVRAMDAVSNWSTTQCGTYIKDITAPVTTDNSPGTTSTSPLNLQVSITDVGGSTLKYIRWCMDSSGGLCDVVAQTCGTAPSCSYGGTSGGLSSSDLGYPSNVFLNCTAGTTCPLTTFKYYGYDSAGNVEGIHTNTFRIDRQAPTFSLTGSNSAWTTSASVTAIASDASGISYTRHCWADTGVMPPCDPGTTAANTFTNGVAQTQTTSGPSWYMCTRAMDTVGNWTPALTSGNYATYCWGPVRVDVTAPTPNPPIVSVSSPDASTISATLSTGSDSNSGLNSTPYGFSIDGGVYSWQASSAKTFSGYSCGVSHTVTGKIRDVVGNETGVGSGSVTPVCVPAAPTGFTATPVSQTQINLSWTDNATSETGYYVYRGGTPIATLGVNSVSYSDVGLTATTTYSYYVVAYNAGGNSVASNTASATTDQATPGVPTIGTATSTGQTTATLAYTANAPLTATSLNVYASTTLIGSFSVGSPISVTGLTANTSYYFSIVAYVTTNGRSYYSGNSANSNTITTLPNPPATPSLSATSGSCTQNNLSWNAVSGATSYTLTRVGYGVIYSGSGTSFNDTGLSGSTAYNYTVTATNTGGTSSAGSGSITTPSCISAPPAVSSVNVQEANGGGGLTASWSSVGANGYKVYVKGGRTNSSTSTLVGDIPGTSVSPSLPGQCPSSYIVTVVAYNTDASVSGNDSSCTTAFGYSSLSNATTPSGVKCSTPTTATLLLKSCTGGFLLE